MDEKHTILTLQAMCPYDEMEALEKEIIIKYLQTHEDAYFRENLIAHMTASCWIVNPTRDKVLLIYHNLYDSWGWCGGHADGECDLLQVAIKEAKEETGLVTLKQLKETPLSCEILPVDRHYKHGKAVNAHLHLNLTYAFEADETQCLRVKPDENSGVAWFDIKTYESVITETNMIGIYRKLTNQILKR